MEDFFNDLINQKHDTIAITRSTLENVINKMVKKGKISREEGLNLYNELSNENLKTQTELEETLKNLIHEFFEKSSFPSRAEFESIKKRVTALELEDRDDI